jgi:hypothetical protein
MGKHKKMKKQAARALVAARLETLPHEAGETLPGSPVDAALYEAAQVAR